MINKIIIAMMILMLLPKVATVEEKKDYFFPVPVTEKQVILTTTYNNYKGKIGRQHCDIAVVVGTPLYAIDDGYIQVLGLDDVGTHQAGLYIVLVTVEGYRIVYGHCRRTNPFNVIQGQKVKGGQLIGWSGNTGNSSGPHLHLQIFKKGRTVNPYSLFGRVNGRAYYVK